MLTGVESTSEDEFLSLLFGTRTSPALHQFLASSLGEAVIVARTTSVACFVRICLNCHSCVGRVSRG